MAAQLPGDVLGKGTAPSGVSTAIRRCLPRKEGRFSLVESADQRLVQLHSTQTQLRSVVGGARDDARVQTMRLLCGAARAAQTCESTVTVLLHMRAGAAAGDRQEAFDYALDVMRHQFSIGGEVSIVRLQAAWHGTVPSAVGALEAAWGEPVSSSAESWIVVAVQDADRFSEAVLRDIVYICGTKHADARREVGGRRSFVLLLGVGTSEDSIHASLGVTESTLIAPVPVYMPLAEVSFHSVVSRALIGAKIPIILSPEVFTLLRNEFVDGTGSISVLEYMLNMILSIQFSRHDLISLFSDPRAIPEFHLAQGESAPSSNDEVARQAERDQELKSWSSRVTEILEEKMTMDMAWNLASGKSCISFGATLSDQVVEKVADGDLLLKSQGTEDMSSETVLAIQANHLDLSSIRVETRRAFEKLCFWRWTWGAVHRVTWKLVKHLKLELEGVCGPSSWGGRCAQPALMRKRLRGALFEDFLPASEVVTVPSGSPLAHSDASLVPGLDDKQYRKLGHDSRKVVLEAVKVRMLKLSWGQLAGMLDVWKNAIVDSIKFDIVLPGGEELSSLLPRIESLRNTVESHTSNLHCGDHPLPESAALPNASTEGAGCEVGSREEGTIAPMGPKRTFDSAFDVANSGLRSGANRRRASGSAALKNRREQMFAKQAAIAKSSNEPRKRACEDAQTVFVDMLNLVVPLQTQSLYEFMFFSDAKILQGYVGGSGRGAEPRRSFISSMRNPWSHFGNLKEHEYPDIALSYRLLAEGGQTVNVCDWCNTYVSLRASALTADTESAMNEEDRQGDDPVLRAQAEFAHCLPELEFLGVLKHTNRRADHVIRMAFE